MVRWIPLGNSKIYNPFSIMNYVFNRFRAEPYWMDSGSTNIIRILMDRIDSENLATMTNLLAGGAT